MRLFKRMSTSDCLSLPVSGQSLSLANEPAKCQLAIKPANMAVYAPVNGEVREITATGLTLMSINGRQYWLGLHIQDDQSAGHFDWQVRVGDSVSPLTLLGTLSSAAMMATVVVYDELITAPVTTVHSDHSRLRALFG
mgnify:FL=1